MGNKNEANCIVVDNITELDVKRKQLRIKVKNKSVFPKEQLGKPITYSLNFKANNHEFVAKYKIGSKDGKPRSGVLMLGDMVYNDILKIESGTNLIIYKSKKNKYTIADCS